MSQQQKDTGWRNWGDHPVVVTVTIIATLIVIISWITGKSDLPSLIGGSPTAPAGVAPTALAQSTNTVPPNVIVQPASTSIWPYWLVGWVVFGTLAGWIWSMISRFNQQQGCLLNIIVGVFGACVGAIIYNLLVGQGVSLYGNIQSFGVAALCSILLITLSSVSRRRY